MTDVWQMYADALHEARAREGGARGPPDRPRGSRRGIPRFSWRSPTTSRSTGNFAQARKHAELLGEAGHGEPAREPRPHRARRGRPGRRRARGPGRARALPDAARPAADPRARPARPPGLPRRSGRARRSRAAARRRDRRRAPEPAVPARGLPRAHRPRRRRPRPRFARRCEPFPATPRRVRRSRCSTRARDAKRRRARPSTDLVRQLNTPEAYFAASQTYEVLGDAISAARLRVEAKRLFPTAKERKVTRLTASAGAIDYLRRSRPFISCGASSPCRPSSVGATSARVPPAARLPFVAQDERDGVGRVRGVGLAGHGVDHLLGVAVVGGHHQDDAGVAAGGLEDAEAAVERLDRRDRLGQLAGVADHVGVGEVDDVGAEAGGPRSARTASSVICAALICGWRS